MARDVEVDVTANDKTSAGLTAAERNFKRSQERILKDQDRAATQASKGLIRVASAVSPKLAATLTDAFTGSAARGGPILAGAALVAAPMIGASLAGAVVGGAGLGGLVGGAILASRDARVQAAGKQLSKRLMSSLEQDSVVFVQPLLKQIDKVDQRFTKLRPTIQKIFADSADYADPLVDGALAGAEKLVAGFAKAVARAGPVMNSLGSAADQVLGAVGEMFGTLSEDADEGADAIDDLTGAAVNFIRTTTGIVHALANVYGWLQKQDAGWDNFRHKLEDALSVGDRAGMQFDITADGLSRVDRRAKDAAEGMRRVGSGTFGASDAFQQGSKSAEEQAAALAAAEAAARGLVDAQRDLYGATTDVAGATAQASKQIGENGRTLSLNSEKGRENRAALSSVANALGRQYDAAVKANGVGLESARVAQRGRDAFVQLAQKAGLSAGAAQNLATKLGLIPSKKETKILADTRAAEARLRAVQAYINSIRGKTVVIEIQRRYPATRDNADKMKGFDANQHWRAMNSSGPGNLSRTGGPAEVTVESNVAVALDGRPFREYTARSVRESERRSAWKQRVGGRH
jgi:hypothetical protein